MPLLVKVRFVNDKGNLSPKTYEYKTRIYIPWGITRHYFNIETSDGNNYRNSKVVITDFSPIDFIKSKDFENLPLKEIVVFRDAGVPISEKHLQEMGRKNAITLKEPYDV